MAQPPGFEDPSRSSYVCKLKRSLYGFKQAPQAWFYRLHTFMLSIGFVTSKSDLFIFAHGNTLVYLLVYVDDIIITGNSFVVVERIKQ